MTRRKTKTLLTKKLTSTKPIVTKSPVKKTTKEVVEPPVKEVVEPTVKEVVKKVVEEVKLPAELEKFFGKEYFESAAKNGCDYHHKGEWQRQYAIYLDKLVTIRGKDVLDLGCAFGAISSAFADLANVTGVDISNFAFEKTNFKDFKMLRCPSWDLKEIADNSFDVIHSMYMMNNLSPKALEETFKEIKRVGRNGSLVFIVMSLSAENKQDSEVYFQHNKIAMDKIAKTLGMKNGDALIQKKIQENTDTNWNFIKKYGWQTLFYKIVK